MASATNTNIDDAPAGVRKLHYLTSFVRQIKLLIVELHRLYPRDEMIWRVKERVILASDQAPVFVVDTVGGYLLPYQRQIYDGNAEFFVENDYDRELQAGQAQERIDLTKYVIPKVKEAWRASDEAQQQGYVVKVQNLLDAYVEYRMALIDEK